jgi:hypothetical protein
MRSEGDLAAEVEDFQSQVFQHTPVNARLMEFLGNR